MKFLLYVLVFTSSILQNHAQKVLQKEWDASEINFLEIESDKIYDIQISSQRTDKIAIIARIEGETFQNVVLEVLQTDGKLNIQTGYTPYFIAKNDKLAAHKVIAIEMEIIVPERLMVSIRSKLASVTGEGAFQSLIVGLEIGRCTLYNFSGDATLHTKLGSIRVYANKRVSAKAVSKYGEVLNNLPSGKKFLINAESIHGDIILSQTK